jgi:hypothetical protein
MANWITKNWIPGAVHLAGIVAIVAALSKSQTSAPASDARLFLFEIIWLCVCVAIALGTVRHAPFRLRLWPALARVIPWYMVLPVCGLLVMGAVYVPLGAAARLNQIAISQLLRRARFEYALVQTVDGAQMRGGAVPRLLRDLTDGKDSKNVRRFISYYRSRHETVARARRLAALLALQFKLLEAPAPAKPPGHKRHRAWSIQSAVYTDPANGRPYMLITKNGDWVTLRWLGRE